MAQLELRENHAPTVGTMPESSPTGLRAPAQRLSEVEIRSQTGVPMDGDRRESKVSGSNQAHLRDVGLLCIVLLFIVWLATVTKMPGPLITSARAQVSGIEWENAVGNQVREEAHRSLLDVFVAPHSINMDQQPSIYVRSPEAFRLRICRLGWYGGDGAKLAYDQGGLARRNHTAGARCGRESGDPAERQADLDYGLVECKWIDPVVPAIADLTTGLYLARVTAQISGISRDNIALFTVRDDSSSARLVIVNPTTVQAYNPWSDTPDPSSDFGFKYLSLYSEPRRAAKVWFNRPQIKDIGLLKNDYPLLRYLEREGLSYSLATEHDLHTRPGLLQNRHPVVISGHGEYWSYETRAVLNEFVSFGGNLVATAANSGYWQVRYEASPTGGPGPVVVGYKESALHTDAVDPGDPLCATIIVPGSSSSCGDPVLVDADHGNDHLTTTQFRNRPVGLPEQLLFGVQYQLDPASNGFERPVTLFTDEIASMQSIGQGIVAEGYQSIGVSDPITPGSSLGNIGHEGDVVHTHVLLQVRPSACLRVIGEATWSVAKPKANEPGKNVVHQVLYRPEGNGGYVFGGLTMLWSWGVDDWATMKGMGGPAVSRVERRLQTLTKNMLNAVETNSFGADCSSPIDLSYFFADSSPTAPGNELVIKENTYPGRWATVRIGRTQAGDVDLQPDVNATADLSGWAVASSAYNLFTADVNVDGLADLIAREKGGPGNWHVALGNGESYEPQPMWLTDWAVASPAYDLFTADVNGDGRSDLIAKEKVAPGNWYVAFSKGLSFIPQPTGWAVASAAYDLFTGDVNGDGKADLVAKEKGVPGNWYVALSDGNSFKPQQVWLTGWAMVSDSYDLFLADVTGDGKEDLIAKEKNIPGNWYVAVSDGQSFIPQPTWLTGWAVVSDAYILHIADMNDDDMADLVAREKTESGNWYVALSDGKSFLAQAVPLLVR